MSTSKNVLKEESQRNPSSQIKEIRLHTVILEYAPILSRFTFVDLIALLCLQFCGYGDERLSVKFIFAQLLIFIRAMLAQSFQHFLCPAAHFHTSNARSVFPTLPVLTVDND